MMTDYQYYHELRSRLAFVEKRLNALPSDDRVSRICLEAQRDAWQKRLAAYDESAGSTGGDYITLFGETTGGLVGNLPEKPVKEAVMRLEGKVALVSGGARGMGAAEVALFAREGAMVVVGDVLEVEGQAVADALPDGAGVFVRLDVASEDDWRRAVALAVERFGKLDVLVNNAGVSARGGIEDTTGDDWDALMAVNAKGVFLGTKHAIPAMRQAGGGSIINISSQLGIVAMAESSPQYIASKGAVRLFTKSTAVQYAADGIRANSVHPGPIVTPMTEGRRADAAVQELMISRIPLGRYGEAMEVAYGVLYLASDESSFVTGSELVIDGGWVAQ